MMDYDLREAYSVKAVPGGERGIHAATITMKVKGTKQGDIDGSAAKSVKGAEGQFQLIFSQLAGISPRDPQSGLPTGARLYKGIEVVGRNSKGVPKLWTAWATNETLSEVTVSFWSQSGEGAGVTQKVYYTVKLTNASIATMDQMTSEIDGTLFFRTRFTFQKIEITWTQGGIVMNDDWESAK